MWLRLAAAALVELTYALTTRVWLRARYDGIELELLTTVGRLVSFAVFFLLFRDLILSRQPQARRALHPAPVCAVVLLFLAPTLIGNYALPGLTAQIVFAATSAVVALKEEALYRGVLQTFLESRLGVLTAVALSNVGFTLYHYGAQPFTAWNLAEIFLAGCALGLLYAATGSLLLAVAVHAVNDAIWAFTPILGSPLPKPLGSVLIFSAVVLCAMWLLRSNNAFQPTASLRSARLSAGVGLHE